ncbi:glucan biosynthesis protein D [Pseudooceanicola sp. CBS1P-1]|uniref:Glucan biosynthesis protein D n=1 Tax=Pseudooceanicola albus TaxID=2692189 RepID=A0A6L7G6Q7_9RHOB|nr:MULTISPECIES: glucan biosynthesis protein D [Pseudooceanicola]MBT9383010.1 glucan biosynthesis protein D [Pseudooceanicola endophyticus]MXN19198.1 glucan biosynthesis protein D [Pseudooceanicola albus]
MSADHVDRRRFLAAAAGTGAFFVLPELARAQAEATAAGTELGDPQPFSFDTLKQMARDLAQHGYTPMPVQDADIIHDIDYDAHSAIRFRKDRALFQGIPQDFPVDFFFPGRYFPDPVHMYLLQDGQAREIPFSKDFFDIPKGNPAENLTKTDGFAGFSVQDAQSQNDWMSFLGASYWRTAGYSGQFGLSARGLALDTAMPDGAEEFPRFTRFWLEEQGDGRVMTYALLESPRATGAYQILSWQDQGVVQEVSAQIFLRGDVNRLGLAPLTSMYWFGKHDHQVSSDWRPEVHDSDGLEIHSGTGERIFRPLNNPPRVMVNSFATPSPAGFGLMQRERSFQQYQDDGVFYEKRASAWIAPKGDWGQGAVTLIELPTNDETFDNIVAFWTPDGPAAKDQSYTLDYRLSWLEDCPVPPISTRFIAVRIGAGGVPGQDRPHGVVKIVCDFDGMGFAGLKRGPDTVPVITASRGEILGAAAYPVVGESYWRTLFDLDFSKLASDDNEPINLRLYVADKGEAKTETLLLQLFPSQLRALLASHG